VYFFPALFFCGFRLSALVFVRVKKERNHNDSRGCLHDNMNVYYICDAVSNRWAVSGGTGRCFFYKKNYNGGNQKKKKKKKKRACPSTPMKKKQKPNPTHTNHRELKLRDKKKKLRTLVGCAARTMWRARTSGRRSAAPMWSRPWPSSTLQSSRRRSRPASKVSKKKNIIIFIIIMDYQVLSIVLGYV
jgi:hypothetical protein